MALILRYLELFLEFGDRGILFSQEFGRHADFFSLQFLNQRALLSLVQMDLFSNSFHNFFLRGNESLRVFLLEDFEASGVRGLGRGGGALIRRFESGHLSAHGVKILRTLELRLFEVICVRFLGRIGGRSERGFQLGFFSRPRVFQLGFFSQPRVFQLGLFSQPSVFASLFRVTLHLRHLVVVLTLELLHGGGVLRLQ